MYEELAQLIEQQKTTVANYIAEATYSHKLTSYTDKSISEVAKLVTPTVEMVARYMRTNDPSEYRDYVRDLTLARLGQGYNMNEFFSMSNIFVDCVRRMLDTELTKPEQLAKKERYFRRLQGLNTLAQSTVVATQLSFSKTK